MMSRNQPRPWRVIPMIGKRFGRLIVIAEANTQKKRREYDCRCDCGNSTSVQGVLLRAGKTQSCGCIRKGHPPTYLKHGMSGTPTYQSWYAMTQRCGNPKRWQYKYYGARGIIICDRWKSFENFHADMGDRPAGKTLDRIDCNGNYEPSNCKWSSTTEQSRNRRSFGGRRPK